MIEFLINKIVQYVFIVVYFLQNIDSDNQEGCKTRMIQDSSTLTNSI